MMQKQDCRFILKTALIPIIFWNFYWYVGFNTNITKMFVFIFGLFFLIRYIPSIMRGIHVPTRENQYTKLISLFLIVVFISILNAFIYWNQDPNLTFRSGVSIFVFVSYFYFLQKRPSLEALERTVFLLAGIYFILWLYALSQAPNVIFGNLESVQNDRGYYRILQLAGLDTIVFTYFYCLTHTFSLVGRRKLLVIITTIVCFVTIFLSLTRIIIIGVIACSIFYVIRKKSILFIVLTMSIVIACSQYILSNEIVASLLDLTFDASASDQRAPEYQMAFELYPLHIGTLLFGNGSEHIASSYGQMEAYLKSAYAFNRSDAGFVGIYITYGIMGLILLVSVLWKVIRQKVSVNKYYLKLFVYFIFFVNITAYHFADYGFTLVLALYLLSQDGDDEYNVLQD